MIGCEPDGLNINDGYGSTHLEKLQRAVVEAGGATLLIDTPPELRLAMLAAGIRAVDAVLYTHDHADHVHGIDDLRAISGKGRGQLPIYGPAGALRRMRQRFDYIFDPLARPIPGSSRPDVTTTALEPGVEAAIAGVVVLPLQFSHGPTTSPTCGRCPGRRAPRCAVSRCSY